MARGLAEDARAMHDAAALRVLGGKPDRVDAGERHRRRAHRAGLEAYPDGASIETRLAELRCGFADRDDLGVGGGVHASAHAIAGLG